MKLYSHIKTEPEDFVVEEIPSIDFLGGESFDVFRLKKRGVSTFEAIKVFTEFLRCPFEDVGFSGLKDKFAITTQYITVPSGRVNKDCCVFIYEKGWKKVESVKDEKSWFCFERVGKTAEALFPGKIKGNRFTVKIRNFEKTMRKKFYKNLQIVKLYGFANYFGEQRFGSVKSKEDFILRYVLKGDFETALKIYFLGKKKTGDVVDWREVYVVLKPKLEEYERDMFEGLLRGLSYEKAFMIFPKNLRLMFNFAFQSFLWNEILARYIDKKYFSVQVPFLNNWKLYFYTDVFDFDYLKKLKIPYTGDRYSVEDKLLKEIMSEVFRESGVKKEFFNNEVGGIRLLTDGLRRAVVVPENFKIVSKTKRDITLSFELPPGSYATILLRKLLVI